MELKLVQLRQPKMLYYFGVKWRRLVITMSIFEISLPGKFPFPVFIFTLCGNFLTLTILTRNIDVNICNFTTYNVSFRFRVYFYFIREFFNPTIMTRNIDVNIRNFTKGGFFSECAMYFSNLQISKKKYSKKLSWTWNTGKWSIWLVIILKKSLKMIIRTNCEITYAKKDK